MVCPRVGLFQNKTRDLTFDARRPGTIGGHTLGYLSESYRQRECVACRVRSMPSISAGVEVHTLPWHGQVGNIQISTRLYRVLERSRLC